MWKMLFSNYQVINSLGYDISSVLNYAYNSSGTEAVVESYYSVMATIVRLGPVFDWGRGVIKMAGVGFSLLFFRKKKNTGTKTLRYKNEILIIEGQVIPQVKALAE